MSERKNERDGKQHWQGKVNVPLPQRQHPVIDFDGRRHGDNQRGGREEKSKIRIHAADVHVVSPDDEAEATDCENCPDHHAITENILSGVRAEKV